MEMHQSTPESSLEELIYQLNCRAIDDFEGLSPRQMRGLIDSPWASPALMQFHSLDDDCFSSCPIFCQLECLLTTVRDQGTIKLTPTGQLPVKYVKLLYPLGVPAPLVESGISKVASEDYCPNVKRVHLLARVAGLVKLRSGYLSLTKLGEQLSKNRQSLLECAIKAFTEKMNFGYFDAYGSDEIGNLAPVYTLVLLARYGQEYRPALFYADKYFKAFPDLKHSYPTSVYESGDGAQRCYLTRCFNRFLYQFGLVEWQEEDGHARSEGKLSSLVKVTPLFSQLLSLELS